MTAAPIQGWYPLSSPTVWRAPSHVGFAATGQATPPSSVPGTPVAPSASPPSPSSATPSPASPPAISVGPNGRINGVDGMLDQIAQALARHAGPAFVRDVLPAVQQDYASQARVGAAAGRAIARSLLPWAVVGAGALGVLAVVEVLRYTRANAPSARQRGVARAGR